MHLFSRNIIPPALLMTLILAVTFCKKEDTVPTPVINAYLFPQSGNTTNVFTFDLTKSESRTGRGAKVFARWDWDGDGIWDTPFTRILTYKHRYYAPGTWNPILEMTNMDGGTDTMVFTIPVARGYSAPKVVLKITPVDKGHIFTRFRLDASGTRDDEDSLDQLSFRWDFEGDGEWDSNFGDSVIRTHVYPESGYYGPKFQVRDPSGLISTGMSQITVNTVDPELVTTFSWMPDSITDNTTIIMDAGKSRDPSDPERPMQYRWDWNNDHIWDTEWLSSPQTEHIFLQEYIQFVRLEVRSFRGLTNDTVKRIRVYHRNKPPTAYYSVSTLAGNVNTKFRFDCWSSRDPESSPSEMAYRWDFNGDGTWDTDFNPEIVTMHQFDTPGTYRTRMEVKDPLGLTDTISKWIHISRGTNQTEIYKDMRGVSHEYYGTVLIGDQWWFTRNLSLHDSANVQQYYYNTEWGKYYDYGNLYKFGYLANTCPPGWRVPSMEDWDKLFSNYPENQLLDALLPGGASDFAAVLGGLGSEVHPDNPPINTGNYRGIDRYGYYWSTTKPQGGTSPSVWVITFDVPDHQVLKGYYETTLRAYSVRCVKEK